MNSLPEFTAYDLNELNKRATGNGYYSHCLLFITNTVLHDDFDPQTLSDQQVRWLWGIKKDVRDND